MGQERLLAPLVETGDIVNYLQTFPGKIQFSQELADQVFDFDQERLRQKNIELTSEQKTHRKKLLSESLRRGLPYRVPKEGIGNGLFMISAEGRDLFLTYKEFSEKLSLSDGALQKRLTVLVGPQPYRCCPNISNGHNLILFPPMLMGKLGAMYPKTKEKPFVEEVSEAARRDIPVVVYQIRTSLGILPDQSWESIKKEEQLKLWKLIEKGKKLESSEKERVACLAAFEIIIEANMGLVKDIINKRFSEYSAKYFDSMVQYGRVALAKAALKYDYRTGNAFSTLAYRGVFWKILNFSREEIYSYQGRYNKHLGYLEEVFSSEEGDNQWEEWFNPDSPKGSIEEEVLRNPFDVSFFLDLLLGMGLNPAPNYQNILRIILESDTCLTQEELALKVGLGSRQLVKWYLNRIGDFLKNLSEEQQEVVLEQLRVSD